MPASSETVLAVRDLSVEFPTPDGIVQAARGVSLTLKAESTLGLVGESGSGKTVSALSILRLVPAPGRIAAGEIHFHGRDLLTLSDEEMRRVRGREIAMIFQDATAALNPSIAVGAQIEEMITSHARVDRREARELALQALRQVGLPDPARLVRQYPFELSGGMCQRVMIAMSMALSPEILIADEPTTGLDVTVQAQILAEIERLRAEHHSSVLLITHDLGVIAQLAEEVAVMYAGRIVEVADVVSLYKRPAHPYSLALLQSVPRLDDNERTLRTIRGAPPSLIDMPDQCPFLARCHRALSRCRTDPMPPLEPIGDTQRVACYNPVSQDWAL
jgi:oligopeptide/dipeptide ABC transporter ATP-binding protein